MLCAWLCAGCSSEPENFINAGGSPDAGMTDPGEGTDRADPPSSCDVVEIDGEFVVEREKDFTARFRRGEAYTKTVMLFGGEAVTEDNVLSNAYIFALDKEDARMLAERYPDFYLCSSPGGQEAARHIIPYDLVPATCDVYDQIVAALRQYNRNAASGGDRTSLRFEGAPLELESVIEDATGKDATAQVSDQDFQLVTAVEQLTGESVLSFGTSE
jgi:hypothetical protein